MPVQHRFAGVKPLQQRLVVGLDNPVNRSEANLPEWLRWPSHQQRFNGSTRGGCQELGSEADAQDGFLLLVPGPEPV